MPEWLNRMRKVVSRAETDTMGGDGDGVSGEERDRGAYRHDCTYTYRYKLTSIPYIWLKRLSS